MDWTCNGTIDGTAMETGDRGQETEVEMEDMDTAEMMERWRQGPGDRSGDGGDGYGGDDGDGR